jgi:hypothetical protein
MQQTLPRVLPRLHPTRLPDYQMTPSQWGTGEGSATHKEPAPTADNSSPNSKAWTRFWNYVRPTEASSLGIRLSSYHVSAGPQREQEKPLALPTRVNIATTLQLTLTLGIRLAQKHVEAVVWQ